MTMKIMKITIKIMEMTMTMRIIRTSLMKTKTIMKMKINIKMRTKKIAKKITIKMTSKIITKITTKEVNRTMNISIANNQRNWEFNSSPNASNEAANCWFRQPSSSSCASCSVLRSISAAETRSMCHPSVRCLGCSFSTPLSPSFCAKIGLHLTSLSGNSGSPKWHPTPTLFSCHATCWQLLWSLAALTFLCSRWSHVCWRCFSLSSPNLTRNGSKMIAVSSTFSLCAVSLDWNRSSKATTTKRTTKCSFTRICCSTFVFCCLWLFCWDWFLLFITFMWKIIRIKIIQNKNK